MDKRARRLLTERVDRGEERFERVLGDEWDAGINLSTLDLMDPELCVVGQLAHRIGVASYNVTADDGYFGFTEALVALGLLPSDYEGCLSERYRRLQVAHGYETSLAKRHGYSYRDLTAEWDLRIRLRRSLRASA